MVMGRAATLTPSIPHPGRPDSNPESAPRHPAGSHVPNLGNRSMHAVRQTSHVVGVSSSGLGVVAPGGVLVVAGSRFEAAVEDADESVAELA
jgi:hypothetical protein